MFVLQFLGRKWRYAGDRRRRGAGAQSLGVGLLGTRDLVLLDLSVRHDERG